ncbi:hypothetical protein DNK59_13730 [Pseudomonas sp. TKO26]|nr:hypothetical protein DNK62_13730 [Pseudomonas sp. TKO30]PYY88132.1 hypothetical protein DNK61_13725 [Pseudomonas sp. TKO29]PYY91115.1 hypothetical protein DNK59_13730 [Pseudomonas sp. TKO26]PYY99563.1 hypothetical protein DNK60_13725 [Pseudomonas sp. TKO14]
MRIAELAAAGAVSRDTLGFRPRRGPIASQRQRLSRLTAREAAIAALHQDRTSEPGHLRQKRQLRLGQACPLNP